MSKWVSGIFIAWVTMQLGSEWICKGCEFVNGLLCEMVIWYLSDQTIVRNSVCTNWWWGEQVVKCVDDSRLGLFTDCVTGRLVLWVNVLLEVWATEWSNFWVGWWLADRSFLYFLYSYLYHFHLTLKGRLLFWACVLSGTKPTKIT